jgi:hypothetical protein
VTDWLFAFKDTAVSNRDETEYNQHVNLACKTFEEWSSSTDQRTLIVLCHSASKQWSKSNLLSNGQTPNQQKPHFRPSAKIMSKKNESKQFTVFRPKRGHNDIWWSFKPPVPTLADCIPSTPVHSRLGTRLPLERTRSRVQHRRTSQTSFSGNHVTGGTTNQTRHHRGPIFLRRCCVSEAQSARNRPLTIISKRSSQATETWAV